MTLWAQIRELIMGINDPRIRIDIASTINYLYNLFVMGNIEEEELRRNLIEVCETALSITNPMMGKDELRTRAEIVADELIRRMKVENVLHRIRSRVGLLSPP